MPSVIIVGATGNIGSSIVAEAVRRGLRTTGTSRDPGRIGSEDGWQVAAADTRDPSMTAEALRGHDVAVIAVKWNENDIDDVLRAARSSGVPRFVFVVGAGSLMREDGRRHYDHMLERGGVPPTSEPAMRALERLRDVHDLEWVAVSPPAEIHPGVRTGMYRLGGDAMPSASEGHGHARVSREDFAVAILDEIEQPAHSRRRFTVAN